MDTKRLGMINNMIIKQYIKMSLQKIVKLLMELP